MNQLNLSTILPKSTNSTRNTCWEPHLRAGGTRNCFLFEIKVPGVKSIDFQTVDIMTWANLAFQKCQKFCSDLICNPTPIILINKDSQVFAGYFIKSASQIPKLRESNVCKINQGHFVFSLHNYGLSKIKSSITSLELWLKKNYLKWYILPKYTIIHVLGVERFGIECAVEPYNFSPPKIINQVNSCKGCFWYYIKKMYPSTKTLFNDFENIKQKWTKVGQLLSRLNSNQESGYISSLSVEKSIFGKVTVDIDGVCLYLGLITQNSMDIYSKLLQNHVFSQDDVICSTVPYGLFAQYTIQGFDSLEEECDLLSEWIETTPNIQMKNMSKQRVFYLHCLDFLNSHKLVDQEVNRNDFMVDKNSFSMNHLEISRPRSREKTKCLCYFPIRYSTKIFRSVIFSPKRQILWARNKLNSWKYSVQFIQKVSSALKQSQWVSFPSQLYCIVHFHKLKNYENSTVDLNQNFQYRIFCGFPSDELNVQEQGMDFTPFQFPTFESSNATFSGNVENLVGIFDQLENATAVPMYLITFSTWPTLTSNNVDCIVSTPFQQDCCLHNVSNSPHASEFKPIHWPCDDDCLIDPTSILSKQNSLENMESKRVLQPPLKFPQTQTLQTIQPVSFNTIHKNMKDNDRNRDPRYHKNPNLKETTNIL